MSHDPMNSADLPAPQTVYLAFCDAPGVRWLRPLRPGFRHCFLILRGPWVWVTIDPLLGCVEVMTHRVRPGFDLPQLLKDQGLHIVKIRSLDDHYRAFGPGGFSCVALAKRVLGLHAPFVLTPYQLYRTLLQRGAVSLTTTASHMNAAANPDPQPKGDK